ncbi:MAG: hypothetical protein ACTHUU_11005 [Brachybacterium sp.]
MNEQQSPSRAAARRVLRAASMVTLVLALATCLAYTLTRSPAAFGATLPLIVASIVLASASRVMGARGQAQRQSGVLES